MTYPPMSIIVLRLLIQLAICAPPMDHAPAHRDCGGHDMIDEFWLAGMAHGIGDEVADQPGETVRAHHDAGVAEHVGLHLALLQPALGFEFGEGGFTDVVK